MNSSFYDLNASLLEAIASVKEGSGTQKGSKNDYEPLTPGSNRKDLGENAEQDERENNRNKYAAETWPIGDSERDSDLEVRFMLHQLEYVRVITEKETLDQAKKTLRELDNLAHIRKATVFERLNLFRAKFPAANEKNFGERFLVDSHEGYEKMVRDYLEYKRDQAPARNRFNMALLKLRQRRSLESYVKKFRELAYLADQIFSDEVLVHMFINGLKLDLRRAVEGVPFETYMEVYFHCFDVIRGIPCRDCRNRAPEDVELYD